LRLTPWEAFFVEEAGGGAALLISVLPNQPRDTRM
jgi:hypothetical protein